VRLTFRPALPGLPRSIRSRKNARPASAESIGFFSLLASLGLDRALDPATTDITHERCVCAWMLLFPPARVLKSLGAGWVGAGAHAFARSFLVRKARLRLRVRGVARERGVS
jgi:hypothetical protein